jgi:hypothetical protein
MQPPAPAFARVENALSQSPQNSQLRADETYITPSPFPVSVQVMGLFRSINSLKAADNKAAAAAAEAWWHSR